MRSAKLDKVHDVAVERLRIERAGIEPPKDEEAMRRAMKKLARKERREKRIARRTVPLESLIEEPAAPSNMEALEAVDAYLRLLERATWQQRAIIDASVRFMMRREEIAAMLGITPNAVSCLRKAGLRAIGRSASSPEK